MTSNQFLSDVKERKEPYWSWFNSVGLFILLCMGFGG